MRQRRLRAGVCILCALVALAGCGRVGESAADSDADGDADTEVSGETVERSTTDSTDNPFAADDGSAEPESEADSVSPAVAAEVRTTFTTYADALQAGDGAAAATQVTAETIAWYDELRVLAQTGDEAALMAAPLLDSLSVLPMRAQIGAELAAITTGQDLFAKGVELGLGGQNLAGIELLTVRAGEADTDAFGIVAGQPAFRFIDDAGWKLDLQYSTGFLFESTDEAGAIELLSGGAATDRIELFSLVAQGFGTTFADLSQPAAAGPTPAAPTTTVAEVSDDTTATTGS